MTLAAVQALTFDIFGTVVDWRGGVARQVAALLGARGVEQDWFAFADRWRSLYQPAMEEVRSGRRPWVKLDLLHRENLVRVLAEFGISGLDNAAIDQLNLAWHRLDPWPDVLPGLARLKPRYTLAPLSNGHVALIVAMAKRAGLPWDMILGAELARAYKPQPAVYLTGAEMLGLAPAACLMVAAHANDLEAARACGLRTAFVARPAEYGAGAGGQPDRDLTRFDLSVTSFTELADQLGC